MKKPGKFLIFFSLVGLLAPLVAGAQYGLEETATRSGLKPENFEGFPALIGAILFGLLSFIGVIFLILLIYGGFLWMTSAGSPDKLRQAGQILRNSAVGILIVLTSFAIAAFVLSTVLGGAGFGSGAGNSSASNDCVGSASSGTYQCVISTVACTDPPNNGTVTSSRVCNFVSTPVCCIIP